MSSLLLEVYRSRIDILHVELLNLKYTNYIMAGEMGNFGQSTKAQEKEKDTKEVDVHGMFMQDGTVYRTDGQDPEEIKNVVDSDFDHD